MRHINIYIKITCKRIYTLTIPKIESVILEVFTSNKYSANSIKKAKSPPVTVNAMTSNG
jgi:hypothetical protein